MVGRLVAQLKDYPEVSNVVLTENVPEDFKVVGDDTAQVVRNATPKGFAHNHNAAFALCRTPYFCVLNPDIALTQNPFPALVACLAESRAALVAPLIYSPAGQLEDSARCFPTGWSLLKKALGRHDGIYVIDPQQRCFCPDWVAGMFMLFRSDVFSALNGFDESFYLYYEDVDICRRLTNMGETVVLCTDASAIHDARRASRRSFRHLRWHLSSMTKYLWRYR